MSDEVHVGGMIWKRDESGFWVNDEDDTALLVTEDAMLDRITELETENAANGNLLAALQAVICNRYGDDVANQIHKEAHGVINMVADALDILEANDE